MKKKTPQPKSLSPEEELDNVIIMLLLQNPTFINDVLKNPTFVKDALHETKKAKDDSKDKESLAKKYGITSSDVDNGLHQTEELLLKILGDFNIAPDT